MPDDVQPNKQAEIASIEEQLSNPRQLFLCCLPGGVIVGIMSGLWCAWFLHGGWPLALVTGIPFGLFVSLFTPALAQNYLAKQLAALKGEKKVTIKQLVKLSPQLWLLICCFLVSVFALGSNGRNINKFLGSHPTKTAHLAHATSK